MSTLLTRWLAQKVLRSRLLRVTMRPPDFVIGDERNPYLRRWWVIPRNQVFNIYLHQFLRDDDDRALHDHPWWSVSLSLSGDLREIYKTRRRLSHHLRRGWCDDRLRLQDAGHNVTLGKGEAWRIIRPGDVVVRSGRCAHRMIVPGTSGAWTLFITGPVYRNWGFHCPNGWRYWRDFVGERDMGKVGRGCGE